MSRGLDGVHGGTYISHRCPAPLGGGSLAMHIHSNDRALHDLLDTNGSNIHMCVCARERKVNRVFLLPRISTSTKPHRPTPIIPASHRVPRGDPSSELPHKSSHRTHLLSPVRTARPSLAHGSPLGAPCSHPLRTRAPGPLAPRFRHAVATARRPRPKAVTHTFPLLGKFIR